jgi:hypothetical protein
VPLIEVLFSFISVQAESRITEHWIADLFSLFGLVVNVAIKRNNFFQVSENILF